MLGKLSQFIKQVPILSGKMQCVNKPCCVQQKGPSIIIIKCFLAPSPHESIKFLKMVTKYFIADIFCQKYVVLTKHYLLILSIFLFSFII